MLTTNIWAKTDVKNKTKLLCRTHFKDLTATQVVKLGVVHMLCLFFSHNNLQSNIFSLSSTNLERIQKKNMELDRSSSCHLIKSGYSGEFTRNAEAHSIGKGAGFRGGHVLCIAIILISISSNYCPINLDFCGECCLLRMFWLHIASYQGKK